MHSSVTRLVKYQNSNPLINMIMLSQFIFSTDCRQVQHPPPLPPKPPNIHGQNTTNTIFLFTLHNKQATLFSKVMWLYWLSSFIMLSTLYFTITETNAAHVIVNTLFKRIHNIIGLNRVTLTSPKLYRIATIHYYCVFVTSLLIILITQQTVVCLLLKQSPIIIFIICIIIVVCMADGWIET